MRWTTTLPGSPFMVRSSQVERGGRGTQYHLQHWCDYVAASLSPAGSVTKASEWARSIGGRRCRDAGLK
jgi:hypothetical protein